MACVRCGYDLRRLREGSGFITCPECGCEQTVDSAGQSHTLQPWPPWRRVVWTLVRPSVIADGACVVTLVTMNLLISWLRGSGFEFFGGSVSMISLMIAAGTSALWIFAGADRLAGQHVPECRRRLTFCLLVALSFVLHGLLTVAATTSAVLLLR